jgi:hypothetical protein
VAVFGGGCPPGGCSLVVEHWLFSSLSVRAGQYRPPFAGWEWEVWWVRVVGWARCWVLRERACSPGDHGLWIVVDGAGLFLLVRGAGLYAPVGVVDLVVPVVF